MKGKFGGKKAGRNTGCVTLRRVAALRDYYSIFLIVKVFF